jgi:multiple sugar transport system permease protein
MRVSGSQVAVLLAPAMALLLALVVLPIAIVVVMSFTNWQLGAAHLDWVGVSNYLELAQDRVFRQSVVNTLKYVAFTSLGSIALGLMLALLIECSPTGKTFYRTAFFLPVASTLIAMAVVWDFLLHPTVGLINQLISLVGLEPRNWLRERDTALNALIIIGIWQMSGLAMVLFLAGLNSVPSDVRDAAQLDGARHAVDRFRLVTWPLLGPTTLFVVTLCAIRSMQVFDTVHALTKGGPGNATEVLLHTIYMEGFSYLRMGYASALTVVFVAGIFVLTQIQHHYQEKRTFYA